MFRRLRDGFQKPFQGRREIRREQLGRNSSNGAPQPSLLGRTSDEPLHSISESPPHPLEEVRLDFDKDWNSDDGKGDDDRSETSAAVSQSTTAGTASSVSLEGDIVPKALCSDPADLIDDDELERDYDVKVRQRLLKIMKKAGALDDDETPKCLAQAPDHSQLLAKVQEKHGNGPREDADDGDIQGVPTSTGRNSTSHVDGANEAGCPPYATGIPIREPPKREEVPFRAVLLEAKVPDSPAMPLASAPAFALASTVQGCHPMNDRNTHADSYGEQLNEDQEQGIPTVIRSPQGKCRASPKRKV